MMNVSGASAFAALGFIVVGLLLGLIWAGVAAGEHAPDALKLFATFGSAIGWLVATIFVIVAGMFALVRFFEDSRQKRRQIVSTRQYEILYEAIKILSEAKRDAYQATYDWAPKYSRDLAGMVVNISMLGDTLLMERLLTLIEAAGMLPRDTSTVNQVGAAVLDSIDKFCEAARQCERAIWGGTPLDAKYEELVANVEAQAQRLMASDGGRSIATIT